MRQDQFSRQLRLGFEEVRDASNGLLHGAAIDEPVLAGLTLDGLVRRTRNTHIPLADQGTLWAAVLRCYRRGPAVLWSPVLLEMLAPTLIRLAERLSPLLPAVGPDDIQQQLVIESLEAARYIPAKDGSPVVKRWLSLETRRRVGRWLVRESVRQVESLEALIDDGAELPVVIDDGIWELAELRASRLPDEDLDIVFRLQFLGEPLAAVAREMGCSPNALDCRLRRARARLQRRMAA